MLKNIDPLLNAPLLGALRAMGHGDVLIVSDLNFPSHSVAAKTVVGEALHVDAPAARVAEAILSLMPLDDFVDDPALYMQSNDDDPSHLEKVQEEVAAVVKANGHELKPLERFAFYDFAKQAFCVVTAAEPRFYGCFAFKKGVIPPQD